MKVQRISDIVKALNAIKKEYGDLECMYAKDDEGNGYNKCFFEPSVVAYNGNYIIDPVSVSVDNANEYQLMAMVN